MSLELLISGALFPAETTTFIEFILEEALQTCGMAIFMLIRAGQGALAEEMIQWTRDNVLYYAKRVNQEVGHWAPYSKDAFRIFFESFDRNLMWLSLVARG